MSVRLSSVRRHRYNMAVISVVSDEGQCYEEEKLFWVCLS